MTREAFVRFDGTDAVKSLCSMLLASALLSWLTACDPAPGDGEPAWGGVGHVGAPPTAGVAPPSEKTPGAPSAAPIRVLYRDDWFGSVTLLGVESAAPRALLRLEAHDPARLILDTVDLARGQRVERWEATKDRAEQALKARGFSPLTDSFEVDAARFAQLLRGLGPWHLRSALPSPTFAVTNKRDRYLFGALPPDGSQGDWLFAKSSSAASKRVDLGLAASYSPVFAPDGEAFAFVGCQSSPCDYGLFVSKLGDDKPRRVPGIQRATPPTWSQDGESLYAIGSRGPERCLYKAKLAPVPPKPLACVKGLSDLSFVQDPEGRTGAIAGVKGEPGKQVVEVTWLLLADGSILHTHQIDRAIGSSVISPSGMMALPMQRGAVAVVDLITGKGTTLGEQHGWFFGFEGARWLGDSLVLLRKLEGHKGFEVVAIDVRKAATGGLPWL